jgi:hypothetical protein
MDEFNVTAKIWPTGAVLDLGTDTNDVSVPANFTRHAANFVTSMDGSHTYQFLFCNTGRHVTNKRHVRWNFSVGGWGVWTATMWYGTPGPPGPGAQRVRVDPFTIGGNATLVGNAIDSAASTFAAGAFPFMGDDHQIGTAGGPVDVVAKDPFDMLQFAGWLQLVFGGDDTTEFVETDTGASPGASGFFATASGPFHVNQGGAADMLATYGNHASNVVNWGKVIASLGVAGLGDLPIGPGDPGPDDRIRLVLVAELLAAARAGGDPASGNFANLIGKVSSMSLDELKRARQSVLTSLDLGKTAISTIDAQIKKVGG